jgi:hypothetical protein
MRQILPTLTDSIRFAILKNKLNHSTSLLMAVKNVHLAQSFAHGCNCQGSTGTGIAKEFRSRYPAQLGNSCWCSAW